VDRRVVLVALCLLLGAWLRLAFFAARSEQIALVLLDLSMPKVSGVEVLAAIKERKPEVPFVTAHGFGRGRGGY
jgi:DNA-binding response OmpR family regulator